MNNYVFSFYAPIEGNAFSSDSRLLLDQWKDSWSRHGWNPVVLGVEEAGKHPRFADAELNNWNTNLYHNAVNGPEYLELCYSRWFAYAAMAIKYGRAVWADYDVLNYGFTPEEFLEAEHRFVKFTGANSSGFFDREFSDVVISALFEAREHPERYGTEDEADVSDMIIINRIRRARPHLAHSDALLFPRSAPDERFTYEEWLASPLVHYHGGSLKVLRNCLEKFGNMRDLESASRSELVRLTSALILERKHGRSV